MKPKSPVKPFSWIKLIYLFLLLTGSLIVILFLSTFIVVGLTSSDILLIWTGVFGVGIMLGMTIGVMTSLKF